MLDWATSRGWRGGGGGSGRGVPRKLALALGGLCKNTTAGILGVGVAVFAPKVAPLLGIGAILAAGPRLTSHHGPVSQNTAPLTRLLRHHAFTSTREETMCDKRVNGSVMALTHLKTLKP